MSDTTATLVPFPNPPDATPPALMPAGPTLDLVEMIVSGLAPLSARGYRADYLHFAKAAGVETAEAALRALFRLEPARANLAILNYQHMMAKRGLSPATSNRRIAALVRALRRGRQAGLTTVAVEIDRRKPEPMRDTAGPGKRGWDQLLDHVTAAADTGDPAALRNRAILLLLYDRALRRGEVSALDFPVDLDLDRPAVQIIGKGRTAKEFVTVSARARDAIAAWVAVRGDWPGPLFTRMAQDPAQRRERLRGEGINGVVKTAAEAAGLDRVIRAHALRHAAITQALNSGWDVRDVKAFSRHANVETVLIYDDRRTDIGGRISESIGGGKRKPKRTG
jgi:integrase/recombinase XerC